jgi:hypothetical protein
MSGRLKEEFIRPSKSSAGGRVQAGPLACKLHLLSLTALPGKTKLVRAAPESGCRKTCANTLTRPEEMITMTQDLRGRANAEAISWLCVARAAQGFSKRS